MAEQENSYVNLPEGEYEGRLVYVADLGMQEREFKGVKNKPARQRALCIELIGETTKFNDEEVPRLMWTSPFNTFGKMKELSGEYKLYKVFKPDAKEGTVADWESVLGSPCNVNVVHVEGRGSNKGKVFDNIGSITPIPKKYQAGVGEAQTTDMCVGSENDEDSPAQQHMFGLVKWVFDRRIVENEKEEEAPKPEVREDDIPF